MKMGRFFGILFISIGLLFGIFLFVMIFETGYVLRILFAFPVLILLGISMVLLPGNPDITMKEIKNKEKHFEVITKAPILHKIVWGTAFGVGIIIMIIIILKLYL